MPASVIGLDAGGRGGAGDAEIGEHGVAVGEENVVGLHVAMHEPLAVRIVERAADFAHDAQSVGQGEPSILGQPVAQRAGR